ncbi:MAG: ThiF family adenylyltransferase, partial [Thermoplasmata archaeon]
MVRRRGSGAGRIEPAPEHGGAHPLRAARLPPHRLRGARVTIIGLGAVGAIAAERLAVRGIGQMTLVDRDVVEGRNPERPSLYEEADIGDPKASAAHTRLQALNPTIRVEARVKDLHAGNATQLVKNSGIVLDGTDNLATRYVLNEACIRRGIPFLYGAAMGAVGMVSPLRPPWTPCFRCLLPPPTDLDRVEPCATDGARVAPRVGELLASLALRFLDRGTIIRGLYLLRDGEPDAERLEVSPRPGCPACQRGTREFLIAREGPTVVQLCGGDLVSVDPGREEKIDLAHLAARLAPLAPVRRTPYLLSLEVPPYGLSIFPDGRAIIRGVTSPEVARAVYDRY